MSNAPLVFCAFILSAFPAVAADAPLPPSLFLTSAEQAAQTTLQRNHTTLDALVYYGPGQWQLWLNGRRYAPEDAAGATTILQVSATNVTLRQAIGSKTVEFTLAPHQTYDWNSGTVSEATP